VFAADLKTGVARAPKFRKISGAGTTPDEVKFNIHTSVPKEKISFMERDFDTTEDGSDISKRVAFIFEVGISMA
jgi:hypothetical protein